MHVARDDSDARRAEETSDDSSALSSAGFSVWERGTPARHVCRDHRAAKGTPANIDAELCRFERHARGCCGFVQGDGCQSVVLVGTRSDPHGRVDSRINQLFKICIKGDFGSECGPNSRINYN